MGDRKFERPSTGNRKLVGDKLTQAQIFEVRGENGVPIQVVPGEFRQRQDQPMRTLPGTRVHVVVNPKTGAVERDERPLIGHPQFFDRLAQQPTPTLERVAHHFARAFGPPPPPIDPRSVPRSVAAPIDPPGRYTLQDVLKGLESGRLDTIQATDLASHDLSLDDQQALDRFLRSIPPPGPTRTIPKRTPTTAAPPSAMDRLLTLLRG